MNVDPNIEADNITPPPELSDRSNQRWGTKPATTTAIVFLGLILLLEVGLRLAEPHLPEPLDWPIGNMQAKYDQMTQIAAAGQQMDIVFVGSSVVFDGVNPLVVSEAADGAPVYNAGIAGAISTRSWRWWTTEVVLPLLEPEMVVIGIASVDLNSGDHDDFWGALTRTRGYNRVEAGTEGTVAETVEEITEEWSALFRLRTVLREPVRILLEFGEDTEQDLAIGPLGAEDRSEALDPYELTDEGQRRIREGQLVDFQLEGGDLEQLDALIGELTTQGLDVVLVNMPVTGDFVRLHPNSEQDYSEYVAMVEDLADGHGVRFLDFGREYDTVDLFRDPSHLSYAGADQFSRQLAAELLGPEG